VASITVWNRLEPRPRTTSITDSLAARLRDPLWTLTRQWQLGEFRGVDTGSPAFVELAGQCSRFTAWETAGRPSRPLPAAPLEGIAQAEARSPDLTLRVELGQTFETCLADAGVPNVAGAFRAAFPIVPATGASSLDPADRDAAELLQVCRGRALDGVSLLHEVRGSPPAIPAVVRVPSPAVAAVQQALQRFVEWAVPVYGTIGRDDAVAWRPDRLDYAWGVTTEPPAPATFSVRPTKHGDLDWFSFDLRTPGAGDASAQARVGTAFRRSALPTHVRVRGMPNARFWDFERATTDVGDVRPDTRDIAKLLLIDFMLLQGNDWFLVPLEQPVGTACRIETTVVHDVFGDLSIIPRANAPVAGVPSPWTMFSHSLEGIAGGVADVFVVPPTAGSAILSGPVVEEVAFVRDDLSQLVWGIERLIEGAAGSPLRGLERHAAQAGPNLQPAPGPVGALRYRIQSPVPIYWIPFLPILTGDQFGAVLLERSALLSTAPGGALTTIEPAGRILRPTALGATPYRVREEEIPPTGVQLSRMFQRARWTDGSAYLWVARRTSSGTSERTNPLRFDIAAE